MLNASPRQTCEAMAQMMMATGNHNLLSSRLLAFMV